MSDAVPVISGFSKLRRLNAGGSDTVYAAWDDRHGREVAVKVPTRQTLDPRAQESFSRELLVMGRVSDHPHIVTVYHSGFTEDEEPAPFLVMPLFNDGSYADKLDREGPMGWVEATEIGVKILSALGTAHKRQVLHRDIKPANIFIGAHTNLSLIHI